MFVTIEDRKKLQAVLENALCDTEPGNARFDGETRKNFYLLLLTLIYELNAKDTGAKPGNDEDPCFCQRLQKIVGDFSVLKVPDAFGLEYLQKFTAVAENLESLSAEVNRLLELLNRKYADRILTAVSDDVTKQ